MTIINLNKDGPDAGRSPTDFEHESESLKSGEETQPMDRTLVGQQLINAVQSAMPKVTSYPY